MCGIAGVVELESQRTIDRDMIARMSEAIVHRGPDEEGTLFEPGLAFVSRRLSIIDLADGQQPMYNEDRSVVAVYNGEIFEHPEIRQHLIGRGHQFQTKCDTEILPHLWEEYGEQMLLHLRGQFAFALFDSRERVIILARDRVGICPLHWAQHDGRLLFGSEIKAILASGEITPKADPQGLDHIFTKFAMPGRRTAFEGIHSLLPGHYLKIELRPHGHPARITEHCYWDFDFPDHGEEYLPKNPHDLVDEFEALFQRAVEIRLRADVPVVSYLSGGVDSAIVMAVATKLRQTPIPSFTIKIASKRYDEEEKAREIARSLGSPQTVLVCDSEKLCDAFFQLVQAADCPVVDTACAALFCLAREVRDQGYKVALTGEGADEALAGYPWFKINRLIDSLNFSGNQPGRWIRRAIAAVAAPGAVWGEMTKELGLLGGHPGPADLYFLLSGNRTFFHQDVLDQIDGTSMYADLRMDREKVKRWHPLNQSLYLGYKTILPGLLMNHKGDRVAMANSVETRYPFLDENLIDFCTKLSPHWKLRGIRGDKYILRQMAQRHLPVKIAQRPKAMFRAPFGDTLFESNSSVVHQLLSPESLAKTGYFNPKRVQRALDARRHKVRLPGRGLFDEMALTSVFSTQLWHHIYMGGGLCDLPCWSMPRATATNTAAAS